MKLYNALVIILLVIMTASSVFAQYYADVDVDIDATGVAMISGFTNHPELEGSTHAFTSKDGEYWLLNISLPGFEEYVYSVSLPPHSTLNYVKSKNVNIATGDGRVVIKGHGSNASFDVIAQYTVDAKPFNYALWITVGVIAVFILVLFLIGIFGKVRDRKDDKDDLPGVKSYKEHQQKVLDTLSERQKEILELLKHRSMTQKQIEEALNLPKSSVSRNIDSLKAKGLIKKEIKGLSNVISLKK